MIAIAAAKLPFDNVRVGTIDRGTWRQDEQVYLASARPKDVPSFPTMDDAITAASFLSEQGRGSLPGSTFAITKDGDAWNAVRLLVPMRTSSWGIDKVVDLGGLQVDQLHADPAGRLQVSFSMLERKHGSVYRSSASGTLDLDPKHGIAAVVGSRWAFLDGGVREVESVNPYPAPVPPAPQPPSPLRPRVEDAISRIGQSIELIQTVPAADTGDASTKQARIGAYELNMAAQGIIEDAMHGQSADVVSSLRTADAHLEDANWQLAKKPSPDGRFNGVDIPGALRDSSAAVEVLQQLVAS